MKAQIFNATYRLVKWVKRFKPAGAILRKVYFKIAPKGMVLMKIEGHKMYVNPTDRGLGQKLFLTNSYAQGRTQLMSSLVVEGQTILDIGANIGFFTLKLAKMVGTKGKVIAFEPDERNFQLLVRNIEANDYTNILPVQKAVSGKNYTGRLYHSSSATENTLSPSRGAISTEIEVVQLDAYLSNIGVNKIDFVKMDMDGSEPMAIQGMVETIQRSPNIKILAEYCPENLRRYLAHPRDFLKIASDCGLKLKDIIDSEKGSLGTIDTSVLSSLQEADNLDILLVSKG